MNGRIMKTKEQKTSDKTNNNSSFFKAQKESGFFGFQPKLKIGEPGDKYEQEADKVAYQVVQSSNERQGFFGNSGFFGQINHSKNIQEKPLAETVSPLVQRQEEEEEELQMKQIQKQEEEEELQMQPLKEEEEMIQPQQEEEEIQANRENSTSVNTSIENKLNSNSGAGTKMDASTRSEMETGFGTDFGSVNIHTGSAAVQMSQQLGAQAFTHGNNIYFNKGKYNPQSRQGKHLLAHELTHTLQQSGTTARKNSLQKADNILQLTTEEDRLHTMDLQLMQCVSFFDNLYRLSSDYSIGAHRIGNRVREKFLAEANKYGSAYSNYSRIIADAREEAQNQNLWIGIVAGIGVGIGLGLLAAYLLPVTATSAGLSITLGEAGTAVASAAGQAGVGTLITTGLTDAITVPGGDLEPSGLSPELLQIMVWRKAAQIYEEGLAQVPVQQRLHSYSLLSADLRRQVQQRLNGRNTFYNVPIMSGTTTAIYNLRSRLFPVVSILEQKQTEQANIMTQIAQTPEVSFSEMEKGIWILWMSELDVGDSDMLDLDAIENHLATIGLIGENSVLGVDFGDWTSEQDELNAIYASIRHAGRIRGIFDRMQTLDIEVLNLSNPFTR